MVIEQSIRSWASVSPQSLLWAVIPVRHKEDGKEKNLSISTVESEIRRLIDSGAVGIFHNAKFDQPFLQHCGGEPMGLWDSHKSFEDTIILAYLSNTRMKRKGLKHLSKVHCDIEMIELEGCFHKTTRGNWTIRC